ncbi:hypothetical protein C8J57DRAFT_35811 [Mycena rebaudengoi]|nr:hypothetical protein C8J57DRAFT_35811 [Mycena rebaudengoi]
MSLYFLSFYQISGISNSTVAPLPSIQGPIDIILDIYSPQSTNRGPVNQEYGDIDRLVQLGSKALDMISAAYLFYKRPMLTADEIVDAEKDLVSDEKLQYWLSEYNIKSNFRGDPDILNSPTEMRKFFHAYIGAVYIRNGFAQVEAWISALIDPDATLSSHVAPQPLTAPPPLPTNQAAGPPPNSSLVTLALVNQVASQKGIPVTYPAQQTGPPHAPTWTVSCCMSGVEKGRASGKSQKIAKEEAARQAFIAVGWSV